MRVENLTPQFVISKDEDEKIRQTISRICGTIINNGNCSSLDIVNDGAPCRICPFERHRLVEMIYKERNIKVE